MTQQRLVISGATGHIGSKLTHALLAQGHRVVALARASGRLDALKQAGAETAAGDVHDAAFLTEALRGADAAFLMVPPDEKSADVLATMRRSSETLAAAVQASGLRQVVSLSSTLADQAMGNGPVFAEQEARLNAIGGLAVAHLRPAFFMENLLAQVGLIPRLGSLATAIRPDQRFPMVATQDIAAKAAELLGGGPLAGHSAHYLLGPRDYSMQDAAAILGSAIGRPDLAYTQLSYDQARQGLLKAGLTESMADLMDEMVRTQNEGKMAPPAARTAANTTPTTLEEFAQTVFAPAFRQAK